MHCIYLHLYSIHKHTARKIAALILHSFIECFFFIIFFSAFTSTQQKTCHRVFVAEMWVALVFAFYLRRFPFTNRLLLQFFCSVRPSFFRPNYLFTIPKRYQSMSRCCLEMVAHWNVLWLLTDWKALSTFLLFAHIHDDCSLSQSLLFRSLSAKKIFYTTHAKIEENDGEKIVVEVKCVLVKLNQFNKSKQGKNAKQNLVHIPCKYISETKQPVKILNWILSVHFMRTTGTNIIHEKLYG